MKPPPHVALVLAAGGSRRLGVPKQLLTRGGETLVHRAVRLAAETQPARMLLVVGGYSAQVRDAVADIPVEIVFNAGWEEGLASSLRTAASLLEGGTTRCLVLGCDQPALQLAHLRSLLDAAATAASGCAATAHEGAVGIPVVVSAEILAGARELSGDRGLRAVLQRLPRDSLAVLEAAELHLDVDTQADLQRAIEAGWLDR